MDLKAHWEAIYKAKRLSELSWYQAEADLSLRLIQEVAPGRSVPIIDVGGGASVLVDQLDVAGYTNLTVLDLAGSGIAAARERLGSRATRIRWIEADVLDADLPGVSYGVWHDRAVFHFLTDAVARTRYIRQVRHAVMSGGHVLVATFAEDGPTRCSGLDVTRYSPAALHGQFGEGFAYVKAEREEHRTPGGAVQAFTYCLCQRAAAT